MPLDLISESQLDPEVTANEAFLALQMAALFGRRNSTCSGLTWGYYGGLLPDGATTLADGVVTLTDNATNYVECTTAGAVSANTSGFTGGRYQMATVVTVSGFATVYTDKRYYATTVSGGGIGDMTLAGVQTVTGTKTFNSTKLVATSPTFVTPVLGTPSSGNLSNCTGIPVVVEFACSDETTAITTGTAKFTTRIRFAMTVTAVRASLTTASSSGIPTFDINESGTTILSTKLTIDASELTSTTAATPAVISDANLADDAEITVDFDVAGTGAKGVKIALIGIRV